MLRDILIQKGLSNRESEVAELVTKGLSNKEVANQLFVTEKTVKFHLTNIYKKMSVKSRAQLIVWCLPHMGFVDKEEQQVSNNQQPIQNNNQNMGAGAQASQTIPAGNSTVGGDNNTAGITLPNNNIGFDRNNEGGVGSF
ncbi:MAG: helix-turn-helix transcriptional regulator [Bdellovibrionales bacterium]|nr:helix-turn-helix transcriptional regulator [Bdellovibrionales bacterium]